MMCLDALQDQKALAALVNAAQIPDITCEKLEAALPSSRRTLTENRRYPGRALSVAASSLVYWLLENPPPNQGDNPGGWTASSAFSLKEIPAQSLIPDMVRQSAEQYPLDWTPDAHGKPFPQGAVLPQTQKYCFISLSHSGEWAAAALSPRPVGLDIQTANRQNVAMMKRIIRKFHPLEQAHLLSLEDASLSAAFAGWWAMKEAVMKLCGKGLALSLHAFFINPASRFKENGFDVYAGVLNGQSITIYSWYTEPVNGALAFYDACR